MNAGSPMGAVDSETVGVVTYQPLDPSGTAGVTSAVVQSGGRAVVVAKATGLRSETVPAPLTVATANECSALGFSPTTVVLVSGTLSYGAPSTHSS